MADGHMWPDARLHADLQRPDASPQKTDSHRSAAASMTVISVAVLGADTLGPYNLAPEQLK